MKIVKGNPLSCSLFYRKLLEYSNNFETQNGKER